MFSKHTIYIQSLCGQHKIKIQLLILRFEFWSFQRAFKIFAIKQPFYIIIKHVKNHIFNYIVYLFYFFILIIFPLPIWCNGLIHGNVLVIHPLTLV
jgi:hypothetical protein